MKKNISIDSLKEYKEAAEGIILRFIREENLKEMTAEGVTALFTGYCYIIGFVELLKQDIHNIDLETINSLKYEYKKLLDQKIYIIEIETEKILKEKEREMKELEKEKREEEHRRILEIEAEETRRAAEETAKAAKVAATATTISATKDVLDFFKKR